MAEARDAWAAGCELNEGYFRDGVDHMEAVEAKRDVPTLFDYINREGAG